MLTRYGYNTIAVMMVIAFICIAGGIFSGSQIVRILLFALAVFIIVFTLNFFRDPERATPVKKGLVISPADGKVLLIKKVVDPTFIKGEAIQIAIFMSPLNVHVNRVPITGKVDYVQYIKGQYLVAFDDKASSLNERNEIGITSEFGKVLYTQIAGYVARRIVSELQVGDSVETGKRFGMIKFGSRVDVIVSPEWVIKVKAGDIVTAGETVLCTHPSIAGNKK